MTEKTKSCCDIVKKFQADELLIKDYVHWRWSLRPTQVTLGAGILMTKEHFERFSDLPLEAFAEMKVVINDIESILQKKLKYQKINYLMLMMVDKHTHFHVLPRFEGQKKFEGMVFEDRGWPGPPNLDGEPLSLGKLISIRDYLIS